LNDDEMLAWRGLLEVSARLLTRLDMELSEAGISLAEYEVLVQLSAEPERGLRMTDLADRSLVSRSGLTRRVDGLERRGLVRREACPSDRRGFVARLTDQGAELLERVAPSHVEGVRRHFIGQLTPAQIKALGEALAAVQISGAAECEGDNISVSGRAASGR
jgi:DNA-binding MarR family transcriptional regulator